MELTVEKKPTHSLAYRSDIDGLRGIAIIPVVIYHAFPALMASGFIGVDIFFVISGFLISSVILKSLRENTFSYKDFYARRIRRIFPALALVLIAMLIVGWIALFPGEYEKLAEQAAAGAGFVANLVFWRHTGYFDSPESKPFLHLWSLGVEEQYYIFWPILLAFLWKRTLRPWLTIIAIAIASFALNVWLIHHGSTNAAFYLPLPRFWELLAGSLIACLDLNRNDVTDPIAPAAFSLRQKRILGHDISNAMSTAGLAMFVVAFLVIQGGPGFPGWWAVLPVAATTLVIAAGPTAWLNRTVFSHPWLVSAGVISYSLYLWHWPLIWFVNTMGWELTDAQSRLVRLLAVALAVALAYPTYKWVETPIRKARGIRYVPQLCSAVMVIFAVSLTIFVNKGVDGRLGTAREQVAQLAFEHTDDKPESTARAGTCFLMFGQQEKDFARDCLGASGSSASGISASGISSPQAVLIWGDSHAAHLFYGLRSVLPGADTRLWQLTTSSCPPLLGYESTQRSGCAEINRYVLDKVKQLRPGTVVLNALWGRVPFVHFSRTDLDGALSTTIAELKQAGVTTVMVVGPVPVFHTAQPKLIAMAMVGSRIPSRLRPAELDSQFSLDSELRKSSTRAGAIYVSPLSLECNAGDCLVAERSQIDGIMAFDYGHLTPHGSEFIARHLILPALQSGDPVEPSDCGSEPECSAPAKPAFTRTAAR